MITQDQLKEVQTRVEQLNHYLNIPAKKIQYEEEQLRTQAPEFWEDQKRAEEQMKKVKGLEKWIKGYREVKTLADELALADGEGNVLQRDGYDARLKKFISLLHM